MITLTKDQIIMLHQVVNERYGGASGILSGGMLDSAMLAPFQTFDGKELLPETKEKIICLAWGLIKNHSFRDGNKRIGALVLLILLKLNGFRLEATNEELVDIITSIAASKKDDNDLMDWVDKHISEDFKF